MVNAKESLLPLGIAEGIGDEALIGGPEPLTSLDGVTTFTTFSSMRHDPIASAVYLQKIGAIQVDDIRRDRGAKETIAFPINEKSRAGLS